MESNKKAITIQIVCALFVGLFTGILTVFGQKYLPGSLNSLANSGAVWLIPAFFIASAGKGKYLSILLCIETLVVCIISYYWVESVVNSHSFSFGGYYFYIWLACAVVAGIIFGAGAFLQKNSKYYWVASLLPSVFLAEGLNELLHLPDYMHMIPAVIGRIIIGLSLYFFIYKGDCFRRKTLFSFCALSALGLAGYEILFLLTSGTTY